jgi:hypothetical protein
VRRVVDVFVAPGRLFEYFRERTPWGGPLLIAMAIGALLVLLVPTELFVEQARESMRQAGDTAGPLPDPETLAGFGRIAGMVGNLVGTPILAFGLAGILTLVFSVVGSRGAAYRQYLAVVTHSMLILSLGGLITLPVQISSGNLNARLSLALLAPFLEQGTFAYRVLHGLDIFTLWALVVVALGVSVINRGTSWARSAALLVGSYLVLLGAIAAVMS